MKQLFWQLYMHNELIVTLKNFKHTFHMQPVSRENDDKFKKSGDIVLYE